MTPYPLYVPVSLRSKLFDYSLIGSFLGCLRRQQKVVRHIACVYISWRPPHPAESSTTSCWLFQGPQNDWMRTISHTTTFPAIRIHLICQFACIQSTFQSVKGHNRRIKSRSGEGSHHLGMCWSTVTVGLCSRLRSAESSLVVWTPFSLRLDFWHHAMFLGYRIYFS